MTEITSWEQVAGFALLMFIFWMMTMFTHFVYESEYGEIVTGIIAGFIAIGEVVSFHCGTQEMCQAFMTLGAIYMAIALIVFAVEMAMTVYYMTK